MLGDTTSGVNRHPDWAVAAELRRSLWQYGPMLSAEDNELLTRTGAGTPMGDLFRRFWLSVLLSQELPAPDGPPVRVKVLGEDLVAFRDTDGRVGLLDPVCPHRGASLFFGRNEECGLRCACRCGRRRACPSRTR